jgi:hypothetical protein
VDLLRSGQSGFQEAVVTQARCAAVQCEQAIVQG